VLEITAVNAPEGLPDLMPVYFSPHVHWKSRTTRT
jgi:hypothetical protein